MVCGGARRGWGKTTDLHEILTNSLFTRRRRRRRRRKRRGRGGRGEREKEEDNLKGREILFHITPLPWPSRPLLFTAKSKKIGWSREPDTISPCALQRGGGGGSVHNYVNVNPFPCLL